MAKFFFGAAVGGHLRLRDIPDWGYWNSTRIVYWDEAHIDGALRLASAGEKIWSTVELDDAIEMSFDLPGVQALWIHESLLGQARVHWKAARRTVRNRLEARAPAAAVLIIAAACAGGLTIASRVPTQTAQLRQAAVVQRDLAAVRRVAAPETAVAAAAVQATLREVPPTARVQALVQVARPRGPRNTVVRAAVKAVFRPAHRRRAPRPAARRTKPAYAVSVGTFASAEHADQIKHLVQSKGYIVRVVPVGMLSQVMTPPCADRTRAEHIARGLLAAGLPARLTSWPGL
jgi:cell division septation protein DedD